MLDIIENSKPVFLRHVAVVTKTYIKKRLSYQDTSKLLFPSLVNKIMPSLGSNYFFQIHFRQLSFARCLHLPPPPP